MNKIKVIFLGTPDFAVTPLEAIAKDDRFEIVQVISQPDKPRDRMKLTPSPVKQKALDLNLPVLTTDSVNTNEFLDQIKALRADVAIVIAFGQIVSDEFLKSFPYGAVNVHGSLLPLWRGAAPIQRSLEAGDEETGVALQIMVKKLDAGPVLGVRKIKLKDEDTSTTVYEKLKNLSCDLLKRELVDYVRGNLAAVAQDESRVTIAKKIKKEEGEINWGLSAIEIKNKMRAFYDWPGVWTYLNSKILKIKNCRVVSKDHNLEPGTILEITNDSFLVSCGTDCLEILEIQLESKPRMSVSDFLRGHKLSKNERLGK